MRPIDFGDQYPSDIGDLPPPSKLVGLEERSFNIQPTPDPLSVRPGELRREGPDLLQSPVAPPSRSTYTAVLVQKITDGQYWALRQDGKRGIVEYIGPTNSIYEGLEVGMHVAIIESQVPGVWHVISGLKRREMYAIRLTNSSELETNSESLVPIGTTVLRTGDGPNDKNDEFSVRGSALYITPLGGEEAVYEISLNINVEYVDETSNSASGMVIETGCTLETEDLYQSDILNQGRRTPDVLYFDPNVGFRQEYGKRTNDEGEEEDYSMITMAVDPSNVGSDGGGHILNISSFETDPDHIGRARWTKDPRTRSMRIEEVMQVKGWGFSSLTGQYTVLVGQSHQIDPRWSDGTSGFNRHLYVKHAGRVKQNATNPDQVTDPPVAFLDWTKPGVSGTIYYKDHSGNNRSFSVDKGIIYAGYGLVADSPNFGSYQNFTDSTLIPQVRDC